MEAGAASRLRAPGGSSLLIVACPCALEPATPISIMVGLDQGAQSGIDETEPLCLVAGLERSSEHPLARAIGRLAEKRKITLSEPSDFDSPVGRGVTGRVDGKRVVVGRAASWPTRALQGCARTAGGGRAQGWDDRYLCDR